MFRSFDFFCFFCFFLGFGFLVFFLFALVLFFIFFFVKPYILCVVGLIKQEEHHQNVSLVVLSWLHLPACSTKLNTLFVGMLPWGVMCCNVGMTWLPQRINPQNTWYPRSLAESSSCRQQSCPPQTFDRSCRQWLEHPVAGLTTYEGFKPPQKKCSGQILSPKSLRLSGYVPYQASLN